MDFVRSLAGLTAHVDPVQTLENRLVRAEAELALLKSGQAQPKVSSAVPAQASPSTFLDEVSLKPFTA